MSTDQILLTIVFAVFGAFFFLVIGGGVVYLLINIFNDTNKGPGDSITQNSDKEKTDDNSNEESSEDIKQIKDPKVLKYLNIPNIVSHYIDKNQVVDFYNDNFRKPLIENMISETSGEVNGEVNAGIPQIAGSRLSGKDTTKLTKTMKVTDVSISYMFLQYQKEMIKSGQVSLGLDEIDIELTELQEFEDALVKFQRRFGIKLESNTISEYRIRLKEKAAVKTIKKLENPLSWVLVDGKFKITKDGESYKFTFSHPINEYLSKATEHITITTSIPIKNIEPIVAEIYSQSIDAQIPLHVYGRILRPINRKDNVWEIPDSSHMCLLDLLHKLQDKHTENLLNH